MASTIDIEDAIRVALSDRGWNACAPPLPSKIVLPHVLITRTGGDRRSRVLDTHRVSIDVRDKTVEGAVLSADVLIGCIEDMAMEDLGGAFCHSAHATTLPYINPDPGNLDTPRVTFAAEFVTGPARH